MAPTSLDYIILYNKWYFAKILRDVQDEQIPDMRWALIKNDLKKSPQRVSIRPLPSPQHDST